MSHGGRDSILPNEAEEELIQEGKRGGLLALAFEGCLAVVGTLVTLCPRVAM